MARRQITDGLGTQWDVWDVVPDEALARAAYDRRSSSRPTPGAARGAMLPADLEEAWLCFQAGTERRRFAPIPPGWAELPEAVLRVMLDVASAVERSPDPGPAPTPAE